MAHHRGGAVLLLRAPGPQRQAARPHLREAGGRPARDRRRQPRPDARPARAADSGLFHRAGGPPVRLAGPRGLLPAAESFACDRGLSGRRRRGTRAVFCKKIDAPLAIVDKRRVDVDVSEVMHLIGDVRGRPALIIDDMIDTAGTLVKTAEALLKEGATKVFAACTHAVLSGPAVERICKSEITEVVVTDSVPLNEAAKKVSKIKVLSVAALLARGIRSIHEETSISELFI